jgi:hypothetical protein
MQADRNESGGGIHHIMENVERIVEKAHQSFAIVSRNQVLNGHRTGRSVMSAFWAYGAFVTAARTDANLLPGVVGRYQRRNSSTVA